MNQINQRIVIERLIEELRFLRDAEELKRLYCNKVILDKSLYFHNHPKEDYQ